MSSQLQLGDWAPPFCAELSQYHTPPSIARRMPELLAVRGRTRLLEPSAGGGNLVAPMLEVAELVQAVEIDARWANHLAERFIDKPLAVRVADFMSLEPPALGEFDAAVMNPPLDAGLGPHHIAHALRFARQAISVLRAGDMHTRDAHKALWSKCDIAALINLIARGGFKGALTDFVVVDVRRPGTFDGPPVIDWWEA